MESKTKRMTAMAMLVAMAYIMAMIGRVPVVLFLKYDPKDIIITLGGLMYGPLTACIISVVVSLIQHTQRLSSLLRSSQTYRR